jgi:hypothetical protein
MYLKKLQSALHRSKVGRFGAWISGAIAVWNALKWIIDTVGRVDVVRGLVQGTPVWLRGVIVPLTSPLFQIGIFGLGILLVIRAVQKASTIEAAASVDAIGAWLNVPEPKVINVTPDELVEFFEGHTSIQAQKLVAPYIGKWIEVSGLLGDVNPLAEDAAEVTFRPESTMAGMPVGVVTVMSFRTKEWVDRLAVLKHKDPIAVQGKIREIRSLRVYLDDCELLDQPRSEPKEKNPLSVTPSAVPGRPKLPTSVFAPPPPPPLTRKEVTALRDHVLALAVEILDFVSERRNNSPRHKLANPRAIEYKNETTDIYLRRFAQRVWKTNSRLTTAGFPDDGLASLLGKWQIGEFEAAGTLEDIEEIGSMLRIIAAEIEP